MANHAHTSEPIQHGTQPVSEADAHAHEHPGEGTYFTIFIVLALLTLVELFATYIPLLKVPLLIGLALTKAWLVVQFYMHLRYDSKIFTWSLLIPVAIAVIVAILLLPLATQVQ